MADPPAKLPVPKEGAPFMAESSLMRSLTHRRPAAHEARSHSPGRARLTGHVCARNNQRQQLQPTPAAVCIGTDHYSSTSSASTCTKELVDPQAPHNRTIVYIYRDRTIVRPRTAHARQIFLWSGAAPGVWPWPRARSENDAEVGPAAGPTPALFRCVPTGIMRGPAPICLGRPDALRRAGGGRPLSPQARARSRWILVLPPVRYCTRLASVPAASISEATMRPDPRDCCLSVPSLIVNCVFIDGTGNATKP